MARYARYRAKNKELIRRGSAGIGIAADQVGVCRLQIGGREHDALLDRSGQIRDVLREFRDHAIGVAFSEVRAPGSVGGLNLAGRITDRMVRHLLHLDPDDPTALRCARFIDRRRLTDNHRRVGRQQPAVGLVDSARDSIDAV